MGKTTHGMTNTRLYHIWSNMIQRCGNPKYPEAHLYGGRGITVCPEWRCSFEAFRDWALSNGYNDNLTIDRKDVDGNYCPQNCRWITPKEQNRNTRTNRRVTINGETRFLTEWCEIYGISLCSVYRRVRDFGMDFKTAVTTPHMRKRRRLIDNIVQDCKAQGIETLTPDELARLTEERK